METMETPPIARAVAQKENILPRLEAEASLLKKEVGSSVTAQEIVETVKKIERRQAQNLKSPAFKEITEREQAGEKLPKIKEIALREINVRNNGQKVLKIAEALQKNDLKASNSEPIIKRIIEQRIRNGETLAEIIAKTEANLNRYKEIDRKKEELTKILERVDQIKAEQTPRISPEEIADFKDYIDQGGQLIRNSKFAESIKHFNNETELKKVGWKLSRNARVVVTRTIPSANEFTRLANDVARFSWNKDRYIELSTILIYDPSHDQGLSPAVLPKELLHEISLVHMEEWLHCLQEVQGKALAGITEIEIDVAFYMKNHDIPMTNAFKQRYERDRYLNRPDKPR